MILVTGASGRVGRPLVEALVRKGEKVRVLIRNNDVDIKGVEKAYGSVLDVGAVKKAVYNVDVIYHLAAVVDYQKIDSELAYDVNVRGTQTLLDHSKAKKFIYLSSTSVYGNRMRENPAKESTPTNPSSVYGRTKALAEQLVLERDGIALRAPVIYGPGFNEGFDFVLSRIAKGKMQIIGRGDNPIQWVHISDLIQGLLLAKERGRPGQVYLIAGKGAKTQEELFALLAKYLKVESPNKKVSKVLANTLAHYMAFRSRLKGQKPKLLPEHIQRITSNRLFDISKAERDLQFSPQFDYEHGAKQIVDEYLAKQRKN